MGFVNYLDQYNALVAEKGATYAAYYFATKLAIIRDELRWLDLTESQMERINSILELK